jgi:hypothetical protein
MKSIKYVAAVVAAASGCQPAVATYPHCPVPVLLSRINRVGVHEAATTRETGDQDVLKARSGNVSGASGYAVYTRDTAGNETLETHSSSGSSTAGPTTLTLEALGLVPNKADVDVSDIVLDRIETDTFLIVIFPAGWVQRAWADPKGRKVWVK